MAKLMTWMRHQARRLDALWRKAPGNLHVILPPGRIPAGTRRYLSVVAIAWNQEKNLTEWLEFHRLAGVEHVYLYDDGSTDRSAEIVKPFVEEGFVTYIPWARFLKDIDPQRLAYTHALCTFGPGWRWMAFIDLDEYLFPVQEESLGSALSRYEDLSAIAVPWHMYGFCGHESRPKGLVIENYNRRAVFPPPLRSPEVPELLNWKSIVDPLAVEAIDSIHLLNLKKTGKTGAPGRGAYTEERLWLDKKRPEGWKNLQSKVFRLNHYFTKSREEFDLRRTAGRWAGDPKKGPEYLAARACKFAAAIDSAGSVQDDLILRYVPELHRILSGPT